jgi:putative transposase
LLPLADITYITADEGFLYVAGGLDQYTRRCIGWAIADTPATTAVAGSLDMALTQRQTAIGTVASQ